MLQQEPVQPHERERKCKSISVIQQLVYCGLPHDWLDLRGSCHGVICTAS